MAGYSNKSFNSRPIKETSRQKLLSDPSNWQATSPSEPFDAALAYERHIAASMNRDPLVDLTSSYQRHHVVSPSSLSSLEHGSLPIRNQMQQSKIEMNVREAALFLTLY